MGEACQDCREYVDRILIEKDRWVADQIKAVQDNIHVRFLGSERIQSEQLAGLSRWIVSKLESMQLAVDKAELQIKEKMHSENNIRDELRAQAANFTTKEWVEATLRPITEKLNELSRFISNWQGRAAVWGIVWGAVVVLLSFLAPGLLKGTP